MSARFIESWDHAAWSGERLRRRPCGTPPLAAWLTDRLWVWPLACISGCGDETVIRFLCPWNILSCRKFGPVSFLKVEHLFIEMRNIADGNWWHLDVRCPVSIPGSQGNRLWGSFLEEGHAEYHQQGVVPVDRRYKYSLSFRWLEVIKRAINLLFYES